MKQNFFGALFIGVLVFASGAMGATLDDVAKAMDEGWAKHNTMKADLTVEANFPMGAQSVSVSGTGDVAYKRADGKEKYRQAMTVAMPEPLKMEMKFESVFDGETIHVMTDMMGMKTVKQEKPTLENGALPPGGKMLVENLQKEMTVTVKADGEVDGKKVYVLDAKPKKKNQDVPMDGMVLYIDQAEGMLVKIEVTQPGGTNLAVVNIKNVQYDVELADSLFAAPTK